MRTGYFFLLGFVFVLAFLVSACGSMPKEYVAADEDTYNAVWPVYEKYFEADPALTEQEKQSKRDVGLTWKGRIDEAKKGAK